MVFWVLLVGLGGQFGTDFGRIRRREFRVVPVGQKSATGLDTPLCVIPHCLEFPDRTDPLEVTHMGAIGQVHAVDVGVNRRKGQQVHGGVVVVG